MKLAQILQPTASKNQFAPVNFHDFCETILTKMTCAFQVLNLKTV
jgi:hypothetical protein